MTMNIFETNKVTLFNNSILIFKKNNNYPRLYKNNLLFPTTVRKIYQVTVYTWETIVGDNNSTVGHSSLKIEKIIHSLEGKEVVKSKYLSFRPKYAWMVNPLTIFFPVKGNNLKNLSEDIEIDGSPNRKYTRNISEREYKTLSKYIESTNDEIDRGNYLYQLLPGLSILNIAKKLTNTLAFDSFASCPFSGMGFIAKNRDLNPFNEITNIIASHCSLSVASALDNIMKISVSRFAPWGITPSDLANILEKSDEAGN